jgi:diguanylate cyclase (GGDEF)-like protein
MRKGKNFAARTKSYSKEIEQVKQKAETEKNIDKNALEVLNLYSLLEITRSINTLQDFNRLLELIVDSAITLTKADRGFLMLFSKNGGLEFRVTRNIDKKTLEGGEFKISRTVVNHVLATSKPLFLSDIYKDDKFKISDSIEALGLHMVMCVPLMAKERLLGLIYVDSQEETEIFTKTEEKIFEAFAAQASVAIENSYLYDSSIHDTLTGLYNYGYLRSRLEEEITRASRYKKEVISFMMLDFDDFKSMNDSHSHIFGNSILVKVAGLIKETVRKYDIPARYGGDEYAILMPGADERDAWYLAQRLQKAIAALKFSIGKETISITVSIGISTFPVEKIIDSENVILEADHALFVAKRKGGNQIVQFGLHKDKRKHGPEFIGKSRACEEVKEMISKLARTDATILITGETGTGKELITELIHKEGSRSNKPLVVVNCGAIPDNLLESELFGHEKGAFTGAYKQHKGKFELAQGGTIFLDEIGELPVHLQVKILRAIEQKEIERIGGKAPIKLNVRVIAASNRNLENGVEKGSFRKDLFYRLSVVMIHLPPLRERPEDIEMLSDYYLNQMNKRYQRKFLGFTESAMDAMVQHHWSGNVRELIHRIERAVIIGSGQYLDKNDLGLISSEFKELKTLRELEADNINYALVRHRWNITNTAKALDVDRKTLRRLIKKYNINKPGSL